MAVLMYTAFGTIILPVPKVRQDVPLSILIPSRHHPEKFAEVCMLHSGFIKWAVNFAVIIFGRMFINFRCKALKNALATVEINTDRLILPEKQNSKHTDISTLCLKKVPTF